MQTNTKPLTQDRKDLIIKTFDELLEDGTIEAGRSLVYDILEDAGYIKLSGSKKREYYEQAQRFLLKLDEQKPKKERKPYLFTGKKSLTVVFKSKVLILEDYFAKIDAEGNHIKNILK